MGPLSESLPRLLAASGWRLTPVPFFFRIVHPFPFLRNIVYLRRNARHAVLARRAGLSRTGLGSPSSSFTPSWRPGRCAVAEHKRRDSSRSSPAGPTSCGTPARVDYGMCAVRNAETLRILYPRDDARFVRLRVKQADRTIGWAVLLNNRWFNHKQFGRHAAGLDRRLFRRAGGRRRSRSLRNPLSSIAGRRPDRRQPVARRLAQGAAHVGIHLRTVQFQFRLVPPLDPVVPAPPACGWATCTGPAATATAPSTCKHEQDPRHRRRGLHRLPSRPPALGRRPRGGGPGQPQRLLQRAIEAGPAGAACARAPLPLSSPRPGGRRGGGAAVRRPAVRRRGPPGRAGPASATRSAIRSPTSRATSSAWPTSWKVAGTAGSNISSSPRRAPSMGPTRPCPSPSITTSTIP